VIGRCLEALTLGHRRGEVEIIVVCNGCSDNTAEIARGFGPPVRVIETDIGSKTHALNLGDGAASGFPRIYQDADVVMDLNAVRKIAAVLETEGVFAAAPLPITVHNEQTRWGVRAYYRFWETLPYIKEGMIAAGAYALNEMGRSRFKNFPDVIADDGYVRLLFQPHERVLVTDAECRVSVPLHLKDLVKIRTRSRMGVLELRRLYPDLYQREASTKRYSRALIEIFRRPDLYFAAFAYVYVAAFSWARAHQKARNAGRYIWERDDSSRGSVHTK
jgi:glycosyltransferase involved in cell wall biosynthesis